MIFGTVEVQLELKVATKLFLAASKVGRRTETDRRGCCEGEKVGKLFLKVDGSVCLWGLHGLFLGGGGHLWFDERDER